MIIAYTYVHVCKYIFCLSSYAYIFSLNKTNHCAFFVIKKIKYH